MKINDEIKTEAQDFPCARESLTSEQHFCQKEGVSRAHSPWVASFRIASEGWLQWSPAPSVDSLIEDLWWKESHKHTHNLIWNNQAKAKAKSS